jgi:hypothetical protein
MRRSALLWNRTIELPYLVLPGGFERLRQDARRTAAGGTAALFTPDAEYKQVAARMKISESAVKNTVRQLFGKTELEPGASWCGLRWNGSGICYNDEWFEGEW